MSTITHFLTAGQKSLASIILRGAQFFKNESLQVELCTHLLGGSNEVTAGDRATQWYAYNVVIAALGPSALPKQLAEFYDVSCRIQSRSIGGVAATERAI